MAKSPSQRIDELAAKFEELNRKLDQLTLYVELQLDTLAESLKEAKSSFTESVKEQQQTSVKHTERIAAVEEKSKSLEKLSDRGWQVWLAVFGSLLAIGVAVFKK